MGGNRAAFDDPLLVLVMCHYETLRLKDQTTTRHGWLSWEIFAMPELLRLQ
jgi:hypothetical protein